MRGAAVSVVVPAHNEQAVIGRCLRSLTDGAEPGELDIVVVCNGCTDATAEEARAAAPEATVLELEQASKVAALNAGDDAARHFPRFYVDADVELPIASLRRVAGVLDEGAATAGRPGAGTAQEGERGTVLCAAPRAAFVLEGRPWAVRAFYDVWKDIPYHRRDMVGSGVYALSRAGRERFAEFPELTADDQFVHQLFGEGERRAVDGAEFYVHTPRTMRGLLSMRVRAYRGNRELAASGLALAQAPRSGARTALAKARRLSNVPAVGVYVGVNLAAKAIARRARPGGWERDDSARRQQDGAPAATGSTRRQDGGARGRAGRRSQVGPPPGGSAAGTAHCYVTSHYPAVSHTFVLREVMGLRAAGHSVETVSVHRTAPDQLLAEVDRREAARTWSLLPLDPAAFARSHLRAAVRHPRAYLGTLGFAVSVAPPGARARLWQLLYFAEAVHLWDHARRQGTRHLHAHLTNVAADICWLAARFGRLAEPGRGWWWSFTMHGPTELFEVERFNLARKVPNADLVVCISDFARSQLMYLSKPQDWSKLTVVHCGADLARYRAVEPAAHDGLAMLGVGRLVPQKGFHVLVDALGLLVEQGHDARLVLVGSGPEEEQLRRRAAQLGVADRLVLAGAVGQDEMPSYYAGTDVFCLPSFAEGVPVVLMEAMATGRPVVASAVAGIPELVEDGTCGYLVPPGNAGALAGAVASLAASPEVARKFGEAGRDRVERDFDSRANAAQLAGLFEEVAGGRHGR